MLSEQENIEQYRALMDTGESFHWERGQLASEWLNEDPKNRTDAQYAERTGDNQPSVNRHRRVYEAFMQRCINLEWSYFLFALNECKSAEAAVPWLELAAKNKLSVSKMVKVIRASKQRERDVASVINEDGSTTDSLDALADSGKKFGCIYIDPPWQYSKTVGEGACENHYNTMSQEELKRLPIGRLAADKSHLHLWTTNAFLKDAIELLEYWRFDFKSTLVWIKSDSQSEDIWEIEPQMGLGNYWRCCHEILLLGVRGTLTFDDRALNSWVAAKRTAHSKKPEKIRSMIERASPGPRLEVFARECSRGWTVFGNQIGASLIA